MAYINLFPPAGANQLVEAVITVLVLRLHLLVAPEPGFFCVIANTFHVAYRDIFITQVLKHSCPLRMPCRTFCFYPFQPLRLWLIFPAYPPITVLLLQYLSSGASGSRPDNDLASANTSIFGQFLFILLVILKRENELRHHSQL